MDLGRLEVIDDKNRYDPKLSQNTSQLERSIICPAIGSACIVGDKIAENKLRKTKAEKLQTRQTASKLNR